MVARRTQKHSNIETNGMPCHTIRDEKSFPYMHATGEREVAQKKSNNGHVQSLPAFPSSLLLVLVASNGKWKACLDFGFDRATLRERVPGHETSR